MQKAYDNEKKNTTVAWVLWFFTGGLGGYRYYLGDIKYAIA
ncbi:TM2 domain-containing protein [Rothia sp. ZJ1223]|nr:TM2 domain-containing protein [Rothia sp. ZJ1223]